MSWILRNPPEPLWANFIKKAKAEGWPLKALILQFAQDYVDGAITPRSAPPVDLKVVIIPKTCEKCQRQFEIQVRHAPGFSIMDFRLIECPFCGAAHHPMLPGDVVHVGPPGSTADDSTVTDGVKPA